MEQQDILRRFIFEDLGVRGEWVNLNHSWQQVKQYQTGSEAAKHLLGQALAAVVMLSATIKFKGSMILQAQGNGALKTLVAQSTEKREIRGLVRSSEDLVCGRLEDMFGAGQLVLTIEPDNADPYQGIVPLAGENLAYALQTYFQQSEQLNTRLWLYSNDTNVSALLIQELPSQDSSKLDWERIEALASTVTEQEMLELDCETILYRLFNEEQVRLFKPEPVAFKCACSNKKIEFALRSIGRDALEDILKEREHIEVGCEFCNRQYRFDKVDIEQVLSDMITVQGSDATH